MIKIQRVYDPVSPEDGKRILIDRLWPRGIKKEKAKIDEPWRLWFLSLAQSSGRSFERIGS
jgi:uncharacterized protein YeaO (DUF488 family)